jgi:hypothetical protein
MNKYKYNPILIEVYKLINNKLSIDKGKSKMVKIIDKQKIDQGYYYLENIGISFQALEAIKCLTEIITQCIYNKYKLLMEIELKNKIILNLEF